MHSDHGVGCKWDQFYHAIKSEKICSRSELEGN